MGHARILDCTLRDGGYLLDKCFGEENIYGIVNGLVNTGIDIIEIGFLQNGGFGDGKTVFLNSTEAEKYIPMNKGESIFTAFADYSRYDISNLDEYTGKSFQAVRECFFKNECKGAIEYCKQIKKKGYLCFVQPVDILGYNDKELIELIEQINIVEPYCFSIVDTFGSMYEDDLQRIFSIIHHNLSPKCKIGFHSHNNLQMSSALAQSFLKLSYGKREVIVDATISGMGRGAGNAPTELIAQYMVDKMGYLYNMDALLDVIDHYMRNIRSQVEWGYNTYFYIAGAYSTHVNNIAYLTKKNSIKSKDIRYILNELDEDTRKRYDYEKLESTYLKYMQTNIDDTLDFNRLKDELSGRNVVLLAAGRSIVEEQSKILKYIEENHAKVISINYPHENIPNDFIYISNIKRFQSFDKKKCKAPIIYTSNVKTQGNDSEYVISFMRLIKCGWENSDNSTILLLRLLNELNVSKIGIAGFDGYDYTNNYAEKVHEYNLSVQDALFINKELEEMLNDFLANKNNQMSVEMITKSKLSLGGDINGYES
ncbi:MAG: hypothetical protein HDQ99_21935 [Lachnospiraceae bacterium]|nr:hypothetical protein [Lachnospiraceae bacterium]MBD5538251.1 hypothetical protein [Lachnospiraceae bacterium]